MIINGMCRRAGLLALWMCLTLGPGVTVADGPLKIFILAGQSNMQGHAHVRTLQHLRSDPTTEKIYQSILDDRGQPRVYDAVRISYLSSDGIHTGPLTTGFGADREKIGPELTFGIHMHRTLNEPILIIKTAWGGRSIHTDFRPPSAGPFVFRPEQLDQFRQQGRDIAQVEAEKAKSTGVAYRDMMTHIKSVLADVSAVHPEFQTDQGYQLAGFVWFQGWNDMVDGGVYPFRDKPGGYDAYSEVLGHLIRDVRRDLDAPQLPFVIGVMGVGGPVADYDESAKRYATTHQNFRDAMAAPAQSDEFRNSVVNVLTENYWDQTLDQLQQRRERLNQQLQREVKAQSLDKIAQEKRQLELRNELFTNTEWQTLESGVSNQAYHYLGSAKILGRIGQAFAEALVPLVQAP